MTFFFFIVDASQIVTRMPYLTAGETVIYNLSKSVDKLSQWTYSHTFTRWNQMRQLTHSLIAMPVCVLSPHVAYDIEFS